MSLNHLHSQIVADYGAPEPDRYPLYAKAKKYELTLLPGDALFIPSRWWHWVYSTPGDGNLALNFWSQRLDEPAPAHEPPLQSDRIGRASFLRNHVECGRPLLLRGNAAIRRWPALTRWDLRYLSVAVGERTPSGVASSSTRSIVPVKKPGNDSRVETGCTVARFAQACRHDRSRHYYFLHQSTFQEQWLRDDFGFPEFIDDTFECSCNLWVNGGGIDTGLHFDIYPGVLIQIAGTKVVSLFPPSETKYLYSASLPSISG